MRYRVLMGRGWCVAWLAWTLAAALLLRVPRAQAQPASCPPTVVRWVERMAAETDTRTLPTRCVPGHVMLRIETPAGAIPVDMSSRAEGSFRRAGAFGLSPMMEVPDWSALDPRLRGPFDAVAAWITAHPTAVRLDVVGASAGRVPNAVAPMLTAWPLWAALVLILAALRRRGAMPTRGPALWIAAAVFALGVLLRWRYGLWGPFRHNGVAPIWVLGAVGHASELQSYGPGYAEVFSFARAAAAPDRLIFTVNLTLSAMVPALVFAALAGALGAIAVPAALAVALAVDPVALHYAPTESYFNVIAWCEALLLVVGALAARASAEGDRRQYAALVVAAALITAAATRIHPTAWLPCALTALGALALQPLRDRRGALWALGGLCVGVAVVMAFNSRVFAHVHAVSLSNATARATVARGAISPAMLLGGAVLVALASRRIAMAVAVVTALADVALRHNYHQEACWQAGFDRLHLVPALALAAAATPRARSALERALQAAGWALVAAIVLRPSATTALRRRTTEALEYRALSAWAATVPSSCMVMSVGMAGLHNLFLPIYPRPGAPGDRVIRVDLRERRDLGPAPSTQCLYYVRTSLCAFYDTHAICDRFESQLSLQPLRSWTFPALESNRYMPYPEGEVVVRAFRVLPAQRARGAASP